MLLSDAEGDSAVEVLQFYKMIDFGLGGLGRTSRVWNVTARLDRLVVVIVALASLSATFVDLRAPLSLKQFVW